MSTSRTYVYDEKELEDLGDFVKTRILNSLVREGLINLETADTWCEEHTIVMRKKGFFRTILGSWNKSKENTDEHYWLVVKLVVDVDDIKPEGSDNVKCK